ncbi:MAG TPA: nucleoside diphosphate kinase regulator [Polyangiaceae bacterium]
MQTASNPRPPILVTQSDFGRLQDYFSAKHDGISDFVMDSVDEELARAQIIPPEKAPPTLVTMNSRVVFENVHTRRRREVTLVYPEDADTARGRISVFSPVGSALLGLSVGQEIQWGLPNGTSARFRITEVVYQPEAAGDFHL